MRPSPYVFTLAVLSSYRLAQLIAFDVFPFGGLRLAIGRKAGQGSAFYKWLADLITCPFCLGIWLAFFLTVAVMYYRSVALDFFLIFFGIAGLQAFLEEAGSRFRES